MEKNKKIQNILEMERKFKENKNNEPATMWDMIKSLHKIPELRDFLTLESIPLYPIIQKKDNSYIFNILISTLSSNKEVHFPWGLVEIQWPEMCVIRKSKMSNVSSNVKFLNNKLICNKKFIDLAQEAYDDDKKIPLPPKEIVEIFRNINNSYRPYKNIDHKCYKKITGTDWNQLILMIDDLQSIYKNNKYNNLLNGIQNIRKMLSQPMFSVAVVGEFNRGKSSFLNYLLNDELLPVGDLPTTAMLSKVVYGEIRRIIKYSSGQKELIDTDSMDKIIADIEGDDPEGLLLYEISNNFLKENSIQFIDTPGAGDLLGKRATITTEAIINCDATIVAVNATMPLSMTEKSFVEQNIFLKNVPRVAVVITRMDQVTKKDRRNIYNHIKQEVNKWGKNIPVWVSGINVNEFEDDLVFGREKILNEISRWVNSSDNDKIRFKQIVLNTLNSLHLFKQVLSEKKNIIKMSVEESKEKLKKETQEVEKQKLIWEDIEINVEKKELEYSEWLTQSLLKYREELIEEYAYELKVTSDLQTWWNEKFPRKMKKLISKITKDTENSIKKKVMEDMHWLTNTLNKHFEWTISTEVDETVKYEIQLNQMASKMELKDIKEQRRRAHIFLAISSIPVYLIAVPAGMALNAVGAYINEKRFAGKLEEQKEELLQEIERIIYQFLIKTAELSASKTNQLYKNILTNIKNEKNIWTESVLKELQLKNRTDNVEDFELIESHFSIVNNMIDSISG